jgi:hypothetical protein
MPVVGHVASAQQFVSEQLGDAVYVPDLAPGPGGSLHPRRPWRALGHVAGQSLAERPTGPARRGQFSREHGRVLQRLASALRQVLQHGMSRVAQQSHPAAGPVRHRQAVQHRPAVVDAQRRQGLPHVLTAAREGGPEFGRVAPVGFPAQVGLALEDGHLVVHPAGAQRVLDKVQAGPDPGHHIAQVRVPLHLLHRDRAPVRDESGVDGFIVGEVLANARVQPVRADRYLTGELTAVGARGHRARGGLGNINDVSVGAQPHPARRARVKQRAEQVIAVQHQVRRAVPVREVGEVERG